MPTVRFAVGISLREETANRGYIKVANAVKYLAYADQTDLFGYHGKVESARVNRDGLLDIEFEAPVAQESDIRDFLDECDTLARVETAECLTNPNL